MEYIEGMELLQEANRKKLTKVPFFDEEDAAVIIKQILTVLNYMHQRQVVHRDIKLENVMIESMPSKHDPEKPWQIKVIDFGTAMKFEPGKRLKQPFGTT